MNFVAHVEVAHRVAPVGDPAEQSGLPAVLVGAALPDLATIGGFRLQPGGSAGDLARGITLHHRTDEVFHADARFRALMGRLRGALLAAGVARGPARACGHVGVELLLDGHLLAERGASRRTEDLLRSVGRPSEAVLAAVAGASRAAWAAHLRLVSRRIAPESYGIAPMVAVRLHRILSRRPRLSLAEDDVPLLADELRRIQPDIGAVAADLVADSAAAVAGTG